jgi:hypothetical protein
MLYANRLMQTRGSTCDRAVQMLYIERGLKPARWSERQLLNYTTVLKKGAVQASRFNSLQQRRIF